MKFSHLPKFQVTGDQSQEYGEWTKKTAQLLKRPYYQVHQMFSREKWDIDEIKRAYQNATKHNTSDLGDDVIWWSQRKRRNSK